MNLGKLYGIVTWFSAKKGYGFLTVENATGESEDIFVHWTGIKMDGYKQLKPGSKVEFCLKESPKGIVAVDVMMVE